MSVGMKDKKETLTEISGIWGFARGAESRERFAELTVRELISLGGLLVLLAIEAES